MNTSLISFIDEHDWPAGGVRGRMSTRYGGESVKKYFKNQGNKRRRSYFRALLAGRISNERPASEWDIN